MESETRSGQCFVSYWPQTSLNVISIPTPLAHSQGKSNVLAQPWIVFSENVDRRLIIGAFSILGGGLLLSWTGEGVQFSWGSLLVITACLAWGIDNNLTRKISSADPVLVAAIKGGVAGTVNLFLSLAGGAELPQLPIIFSAGLLGFLSIGISLVMFIVALRHLGTARTGAYYSLAPFIGAILAVVIFNEPLTTKLVIAGALMGIGLWLHLSEHHEHEHEHESMEHEHPHVHDEHHQHHHDEPVTEPHSHWHRHEPLRHTHPHYPDLHHQHKHQ